MPLYINGAERTGRTQILASSASDASLGIDYGNPVTFETVGILFDHLNGAYGTMTSTVSATHTVGQHNAVFLNPDGMPYLNGRLISIRQRQNRTGGTHA